VAMAMASTITRLWRGEGSPLSSKSFVVEKKPELIDLLPKELREPVAVARAAGKRTNISESLA
jgi:hypothetical protein